MKIECRFKPSLAKIFKREIADDGGQVPDIWWKYKYFSEDSRRTGGDRYVSQKCGGTE
jgi:hypothetical protein